MFLLEKIIRPHILTLTPYASARDEYSGKEGTFLDANENPFGSVISGNFNRYPDPYQWAVKEKIALIKNVKPRQIFLGNGSDEAIDLVIRATCEPKQDNIIILPPTYGMYKVCADVQNVEVRQVPLTPDFQLNTKKILKTADANTKIIWICSPNNPSGNLIDRLSIVSILDSFTTGLVVVDEAYIDFADVPSFTTLLNEYPNLVVLQTFSKAWGLAGLRLGMAFASEEFIKILNKIKYPYNLNSVTQTLLYAALGKEEKKNKYVKKIMQECWFLHKKLSKLSIVEHIFPTNANSLLVKFTNANAVFKHLIEQKIITRNRSNVILCEDCIRISIGTKEENELLLKALKQYPK